MVYSPKKKYSLRSHPELANYPSSLAYQGRAEISVRVVHYSIQAMQLLQTRCDLKKSRQKPNEKSYRIKYTGPQASIPGYQAGAFGRAG